MIYISTGGFRNIKSFQVAKDFYNNGILSAELSGGAYFTLVKKELSNLSKIMNLQIHNYFPPPAVPFVFNLASLNKNVRSKSLSLARKAIYLAIEIDRPIYSFHAGFRINPLTSELGASFSKRDLAARQLSLDIFGESVINLSEEAKKIGVTLLIENNVVTQANQKIFGDDPFLLTFPSEINTFMQLMPSNVKLLLDVAHLKVSSNTLNFNLIEGHHQLYDWIFGYHLSDNDGLSDSNNPLNLDSWFWNYINPRANFFTLEIYNVSVEKLYSQYKFVMNMLKDKVN
jgi:sugar phosphate isomerase/epimerase